MTSQEQVTIWDLKEDAQGNLFWKKGVVVPPGGTTIEYCACLDPDSEDPIFVGEHQCCRVVIAGGSSIGTAGVCGGPFCPPGIACEPRLVRGDIATLEGECD